MSRLPFYDNIELTPEEEAEAILQGKIKKHFYEKHKDYWQEKEGIKRASNKKGDVTKDNIPS